MRLGILGAGGWGKNLVRVFCELLGADAVTVIDPDSGRLDAVLSRYPAISVTTTPPWDDLSAAVIATPVPLHYQLALDALNAGLHVLVEKPLALSSDDVRSLIEAAEREDRILMVDHLLEYHPAVVRLKEMCEQDVVGTIRHMTCQRLNLGVIRSEENAWWSLAPHDVSVVLHLLNDIPIEVSATAGTVLQDGIPDVVHATLWFQNGAMAHIHVSWLDPVKTRRFTVVGEHAMAVLDDMSADKLVLHTDGIRMQDGQVVIDKEHPVVQEIADIEPLRAMAETFLHSIRTGERPRSDGWDGLRVVRVLEAVQESLDRNGAIVRLERLDA
ncbi:Gfo/Idh/MocA family oxidoreductase [Candidatus Bipolaricaulota bacterium]|jgi:UDP-2-acetamido-3-amino-2,3-dideoxy-glucuronate N-acetyltransferase|nr:Gfo/Idh/MocA family oxidoreductase [Candidatus Bipolaricaulota bacterium]TFH07388.1 MAG: Gfo/Idh/MocA family oxidoreductase [Candidatus Atribacteria bacterium]